MNGSGLREAVVGVQSMVYRLLDVEGRPLGELTAFGHAELATPDEEGDEPDADDGIEDEGGVSFDLAPARYPGCRRGVDMNVSALRQVNRYWKDVLSDLCWVHDSYAARAGRTAISVLDLWRIGEIATSIPAWLWRHRTAVPGRTAALFKVAQGIALTCRPLVNDGRGHEVLDPACLHREVETRQLFLNDARACAGSALQVEEMFRVATQGGLASATPPLPVLLGDPDNFVAYALNAAAVRALGQVPRILCNPLVIAARDALEGTGTSFSEQLVDLWRKVPMVRTQALQAHLRRLRLELEWRGHATTFLPDKIWPPPAAEVDALENRLVAVDRGLAGAPARAVAVAVRAHECVHAAIEPLLNRLGTDLLLALGSAADQTLRVSAGDLAFELEPVFRRLETLA